MDRETTKRPICKKKSKRRVHTKKIKIQSYRSRAAFKLTEMDDKYQFLKTDTVIELGSAPGSWTQVITERINPGGKIITVDLDHVEPFSEVKNFIKVVNIQGDFTDTVVMKKIVKELEFKKAGVVLR
jgi:23S rRNA (uridine2552-2'-O)-methyltransferase